MLEFSEIVFSNNTNASKECNICHYWYFLVRSFKYEPYLWNGCPDIMQKAMNFNDDYYFNRKKQIYFYYKRNKETILNRANDYYKNNNGKLREKARNKCR